MEIKHEQAIVAHKGRVYTVFAPAQSSEGFSVGWLADDTGKIVNSFRGKYLTTDDLVKEVTKYLNRY